MAFKKMNRFNIDRKKQCYLQPAGLFEKLSEYTNDKYLDLEGFKLHIIDDGRSEDNDKPPIRIKANVILEDGTFLGDFTLHSDAQFDGKCFFTFDNAALYKPSLFMGGQKYNYQSYIEPIADMLGLMLNNYTENEVAADVNFNIIAPILKLIKDFTNYDMFVNGKRIEDENRHIENFGEYYGRSRAKRDKYPTLYFSQSRSDGLSLKVYDKTREIYEENPQKKYIFDWDGFGKRKVYRLELTFKNEQYKKWLEHVRTGDAGVPLEWSEFERSESLLMSQTYLCPLWAFGANRLVCWRDKRTKQVITLLDIILGKWS